MFKKYREDAKLTIFQLAVESGVSIRTINRIELESDYRPTRLSVVKLLEPISKRLGRKVEPEEVGLILSDRRKKLLERTA